jgi:hypothetical protein
MFWRSITKTTDKQTDKTTCSSKIGLTNVCKLSDHPSIYLTFVPFGAWSIRETLCYSSDSLYYTFGRTPWTRDQPVTKPRPFTGQYKHRIIVDKHSLLEWDSNPRYQRSSKWRHSATIVIGCCQVRMLEIVYSPKWELCIQCIISVFHFKFVHIELLKNLLQRL